MRVRISLTEIEDGRGSELAATVQKGGILQSHHNPVSGKDELISLKGGYSLTYKTNGGSSDDGEANVMDTGAEAEDYTSGVDGGKTLTWPSVDRWSPSSILTAFLAMVPTKPPCYSSTSDEQESKRETPRPRVRRATTTTTSIRPWRKVHHASKKSRRTPTLSTRMGPCPKVERAGSWRTRRQRMQPDPLAARLASCSQSNQPAQC